MGALGAVVVSSPAAAVPGLVYVTFTSATNSSDKVGSTICPDGTVSVGGGASITGGNGQVTIQELLPAIALGKPVLVVVAEEDADGYAGNWSLTTVNACIPRPAGFRYVTNNASGPGPVTVTAQCVGQQIIGGGFRVLTHTAKVMATGIDLALDRASLTAEPSPLPGGVTPITGIVTAACADAALPGMVQSVASTPLSSSNPQTVTATCPAGTQIIHVGGSLLGSRTHSVIDDLGMTPPNLAVVTGYEDQVGNPNNWAVQSVATCAT